MSNFELLSWIWALESTEELNQSKSSEQGAEK